MLIALWSWILWFAFGLLLYIPLRALYSAIERTIAAALEHSLLVDPFTTQVIPALDHYSPKTVIPVLPDDGAAVTARPDRVRRAGKDKELANARYTAEVTNTLHQIFPWITADFVTAMEKILTAPGRPSPIPGAQCLMDVHAADLVTLATDTLKHLCFTVLAKKISKHAEDARIPDLTSNPALHELVGTIIHTIFRDDPPLDGHHAKEKDFLKDVLSALDTIATSTALDYRAHESLHLSAMLLVIATKDISPIHALNNHQDNIYRLILHGKPHEWDAILALAKSGNPGDALSFRHA
jgi:hypothetical protein